MKNVLKKKLMVLVLVLSMLTGVFGVTETANAKVYSWMENATTLSLGKIVSGEFTKTGEKFIVFLSRKHCILISI